MMLKHNNTLQPFNSIFADNPLEDMWVAALPEAMDIFHVLHW
jgi:hypothetical protein